MRSIKLAVAGVFVFGLIGLTLTRTIHVIGQSGGAIAAPTRLTATDNIHNNKIGLYWDPIRDARSYRVFRSTSGDPATAAPIGSTALNFFFDPSTASGQPMFYWVRAENGAVVSDLSSSARGTRSATVQQGPVPPLEPPPPGPLGNPTTAAKATLGKILFWDEQMSSTRTVACGTCHSSGTGGTDPRSAASPVLSINPGPDNLIGTPDDVRGSGGVPHNNFDGTYLSVQPYGLDQQVTGRRSMPYLNAVYSPVLFWDGRATGTFRDPISNDIVLNAGAALESQAVGPPVSAAEMAHMGRDWNEVATRIAESKPLALSPTIPTALDTWINGRSYQELFQEAFGTPEVTPSRIAMAIGSFERTLFTDQAPLDLANAGIANLTAAEQRGRNLFNVSGCNACHGGNLLTDNAFHYIGVRPQNEDTGRFQVTANPQDTGEFRTPSLRNVELRRSYFHNGQFTTLEQVVGFYNRGGDFNAPNKPPVIRPLGLNAAQQADLVAFLRRPLTDPRLLTESGPFERPQLYTESSLVPQISGTGRSGSGGATPVIKVISPPVAGIPNFIVSVSGALGSSTAVLIIDAVDPGVGSAIPTAASFAQVITTTQNTGAGDGWASVAVPVPSTTAAVGHTFFARWYIQDAGAANGFSVSEVARFTVFGQATSSENVTISGRVVGPDGRGIPNALVSLGDPINGRRAARTSTFGYYSFEDIAIGTTYQVSVINRTFQFTPASIYIITGIDNLNFVGR